jgi:hypothetical protein
LIRLYPEEVHERYAEEMVLYFGDLCREEWHSGGPKALALLWARTLPDLVFTALKERGAVLTRQAYLPPQRIFGDVHREACLLPQPLV